MEMDLLPENVLFTILSNLDLLELIRFGRVCQRWRDLCQVVVETKIRTLTLSEQPYWRLNADSLASILHLCSMKLEKIKFPSLKNSSNKSPFNGNANPQVKLNIARWCNVLSEFRLTNLLYLNLGDASTDRTCVETVLASNPNLESFIWLTPDPNGIEFGGTQPFAWSCSSLRRVNLGCLFATDALFSSLGRHCPKLERITANSYFRQWTATGLDAFCGSCKKLKVLNLKVSGHLSAKGIYVVPVLFDPPKLTTDLTHFWSLSQLEYLSLPFEGGLFDDEALYRISLCFPELRTLKFGDTTLSSEGVANLTRLKNLRSLTMAHANGSIDEGIVQLAAAGRLEKLNLALTQITFSTVLVLLDRCRRLRCLNLIRSVSSYLVHRGTAITVQQALQMIDVRNRISDTCCTLVHNDQSVWTCASIRSALEKAGEDGVLRVVSLSDFCDTESDDEEV